MGAEYESFVHQAYDRATDLYSRANPVSNLSFECYAALVLTQFMCDFAERPFFTPMRAHLRSGESTAQSQQYMPYLRLLLEACRKLPGNAKNRVFVALPGADLFDRFIVGDTVRIPAIINAYQTEQVACRNARIFGDKVRRTVLIIETQVAVRLESVLPEQEIPEYPCLMFAGAAFSVSRRQRLGTRTVIYLQHILGNIELMYMQ